MKKILSIILILASGYSFAQTPDDVLRTAWFTQQGTARTQAIGGVMGALGGDISAGHINPAGLGLYKTREMVLSPGFFQQNGKFNYRGSDSTGHQSSFNLGTTGFVFGNARPHNRKYRSTAFAISIQQLANYNQQIQFSGVNSMSSFSEKYLEELIRDRADTIAALNNYIFGSSLAFRTFLIDTTQGAGGIFNGYQSMVPISTGVRQNYRAQMSGSYQEIALAFANNVEDKLYTGGSLVVPVIQQRRELTYREDDITGNPNNDFNFFEFSESFRSSGVGIGGKLGIMYRPQKFWRFGLAFHTPQLISFKDEIRATMTADTEGYAGIRTESSDALNSGNPGTRYYNMITPYRAMASIGYVFNEVRDVTKQKAFISADIEYVHYRGARFHATDNFEPGASDYYRMVNDAIKETYRGNMNIRLGGELKFNTWMVRAGGAYYGSPHADKNLRVNRMLASGGIGYRNHGIFIDLAYVHQFVQDAVFPYRLNDKPNTFAQQRGNFGTVALTLGFKL